MPRSEGLVKEAFLVPAQATPPQQGNVTREHTHDRGTQSRAVWPHTSVPDIVPQAPLSHRGEYTVAARTMPAAGVADTCD